MTAPPLLPPTYYPLLTRLYDEVEQQGFPFLAKHLEKTFRDEKMKPLVRASMTRHLQELLVWRRKVEALGIPLLGPERVWASMVVAGSCGLDEAEPHISEGVTKALRHLPATLAAIPQQTERLAVSYSLPTWIMELMLTELGETRAMALAQALNQRAPQTLRVNTLKTTRENCLEALVAQGLVAEVTPLAPSGITLTESANVFGSTFFQEGLVEVMDQASQLIVQLVAPVPGGTVVDACAGAGGKTLGIAALLKNKGRVLALDVHDGRLTELKQRARRAGANNVQTIHVSAGVTATLPPADRVLVDAPCSGLGALRRNPEARWRLKAEDLGRLQAEQLSIVENALNYVKVGGRLIYATCSFARTECEEVVEQVLARHPELAPVRVKEVLGGKMSEGITDKDGLYLRTWPDEGNMDGFFGAVLRKTR